MKNDTIIINNTEYRIEFNWNAMADFLETEGIKLSDVDKLENLTAKQVTGLIYSGVKEGARMENKPFPYQREDIGAHLSTTDVAKLVTIYRRQSEVSNAKTTPEPAKKKMVWFSKLQ